VVFDDIEKSEADVFYSLKECTNKQNPLRNMGKDVYLFALFVRPLQ
jgi:hypothetical protein